MNILKKLSLAVAGSFIVASNIQAQDARFSQYYASPMRINPAITGAFEGNWRVSGNYRSQFGTVLGKPYTTFSANGAIKMPVANKDYFAIGLAAASDVAGSTNYQQTDVAISASYMKKLSKARKRYGRNKMESYLSAGGQVGFGQRGVNWVNITYSTQYMQEDGTYNQGINSGESANVRNNKIYPDMNVGLMWSANFGKRRNVYIGGAAYHLNRPDISLFNEAPRDTSGNVIGTPVERLYTRWVGHAGGEILLGKNTSSLSLVPGVVIMAQGPSLEINLGTSIRYQGSKFDDFAFRAGVWTRFSNRVNLAVASDAAKLASESVIILMGLDYKGMQFGFSYDATVSTLNGVGSTNAMEVSVIYTFDGDEKRQQGCPTF
jgi:type IX secretion system PorP/SprF family membrane protein